MKTINAIVAAGGTGGHLFPAMAVCEAFEQTGASFTPYFVGNPDKLESHTVPAHGWSFTPIPIKGFGGLLSAGTLLMPFRIMSSVQKVHGLIKAHKPDFVLCTGAYLSYPAGIAAYSSHIPLVLMESNVNPGKTIKMLSPKADLIVTSFEATAEYFAPEMRSKIICLGNPLRQMFYHDVKPAEARAKFGLDPAKKTVLIFGGSLGARSINEAAEAAFAIYNKDVKIQFLWQTGKNYTVKNPLPENVRQLTFIDDMAAAYSAADLVVARSGATTVAELCSAGKASVLVPLPSASCNEQAANAAEMVKQEAAIILDNSRVYDELGTKIGELIADETRLKKMADAAKSLAKDSAAADTVEKIMKLIEK